MALQASTNTKNNIIYNEQDGKVVSATIGGTECVCHGTRIQIDRKNIPEVDLRDLPKSTTFDVAQTAEVQWYDFRSSKTGRVVVSLGKISDIMDWAEDFGWSHYQLKLSYEILRKLKSSGRFGELTNISIDTNSDIEGIWTCYLHYDLRINGRTLKEVIAYTDVRIKAIESVIGNSLTRIYERVRDELNNGNCN